MRIHFFQHVPFESPGKIAGWAQSRGHGVSGTRSFAGETPPDVGEYDCLVVMGGPMSVHDDAAYPWLTGEKRALELSMERGKAVVGVCLGAQLIAHVLGIQFHVEMTARGVEDLIDNCRDEIVVDEHVQSAADIARGNTHLQGGHAVLDCLLDRLAEMIQTQSR